MSFTLIKGTFHVKGYSPDGDSVRFKAFDQNLWRRLFGPPVELNAAGHAQLRMEAIDALETHFCGFHQPLKFARKATNALLSCLGIDDVVWNKTQSEILYAEDGTEGYILSRTTERNRRPVAFVFADGADGKDGSEIFLDQSLLRKSLNYRLMAKGLVYPTYYNGLFCELREEFTNAAAVAKSKGKGLWPQDKTNTGFSVDLDGLTERSVILPKLFRRAVGHISAGGVASGFRDFLANSCEPLVKAPEVNFSRLDAVVAADGDIARLTQAPESLIFLDKVLCKERYSPKMA
jgi:endonuclease YncB( thermonuclease family)